MQGKGDIAAGKIVFQKNCMACHTIEGEGGQVGPELTGIGIRPRGDLLIDIIDPNRSVEGTYRQWAVETKDDTIYGRLFSESKTSVEIIDTTGTKHMIQRSDVTGITVSERSVMPEGFEQLSPDDLKNLLEFLGSSKVKH